MQILGIIIAIISFVAMLKLLEKANELDGTLSVLFAPVFLHRAVFGSALYILAPVVIICVGIFLNISFLLLTVLVFAWHFIFSVSLAKAYGKSFFYGILLFIFPGISMIFLGFGNSQYQGYVDLLWFLRRYN